jgi:two-component system phosphate regulon response regulator PhoB
MGNVLVIEDDDDTAQAVRQLLCRHGHKADVVHGGGQALRWLAANPPPPDVVVLDWMMPEMDGGQVLRALKAHPVYHAMRVMIFSNVFDYDRAQEAQRLGADDYLVKGTVGWKTVVSTVESLIAKGTA